MDSIITLAANAVEQLQHDLHLSRIYSGNLMRSLGPHGLGFNTPRDHFEIFQTRTLPYYKRLLVALETCRLRQQIIKQKPSVFELEAYWVVSLVLHNSPSFEILLEYVNSVARMFELDIADNFLYCLTIHILGDYGFADPSEEISQVTLKTDFYYNTFDRLSSSHPNWTKPKLWKWWVEIVLKTSRLEPQQRVIYESELILEEIRQRC